MANETTAQASRVQESPEADECRENIPPGVTAAAGTPKLKDPSAPPSGENKPLSDTCTFSTPASSSGGFKAKSRLSGLQSALTPILKFLNIGNKCPSPEPLKGGNSPHLNVPCFPFGVTTANCQKSNGGSSERFGRSLGDNDAVCWLNDECLPEITLLDVTCDSTMQMARNDSSLPSLPATPVTARSVNTTFSVDKPTPPEAGNTVTCTEENNSKVCSPKLSKHNDSTLCGAKMADIPEGMMAPLRWLDDRFFPEITLLDVTRDSEPSPGLEISSAEVKQDIPPVDIVKNGTPSSELSGQIVAEPVRVDMNPSEELSSTLTGSVTHTMSSLSEQSEKCVEENGMKASLEATRDISMGSVLENSRSSSEPSGQNSLRSQTSAEGTPCAHIANVTRDISSSSDMSVQIAASQLSTSDMQCNTSSKNVPFELPVKPVEANTEELLTSHNAELTDKVPQPSPKTAESANGIVQPSNLSTSADTNTTAQISCPQNKTPPSNVNSPKAESEATDEATAGFKNTPETALGTTQDYSSLKADGSCDVQSATFDRHSLQKSSDSFGLGEARAATFCVLNNTYDSKPPPKQNGTITLSETSSSVSHQTTLDKASPSEVCNPPTSPKDNNSKVPSSELSKQNGTITCAEPDVKMADAPKSTFEVNPTVEVASGAGVCEPMDHSQSGLPVTDGLSDTLGHQGVDAENNKAGTFNLDDTLDLRVDALVTSTPMTSCKVFHFSTQREEGKTLVAQKKLYGEGPGKPVGPAPSDAPSNIVSDRKTFLTQPTAKSLLPPSKAASQLLKYKPASALPGRCEAPTSGLPMTRQRSKAEALKNTAAADAAQGTTGIPGSHNLRSATTGTKQPLSGLLKPQLSGIPSGTQRAAPGLRPPSGRSNAPASSSTVKPRVPAATNPAPKTSQAKKHPLTRGEALPTAKRKKIDAPSPSSNADASTSSCDAVNRAESLKPPTTSQRALPAKTQRDDAAVPASAAETATSCDAAGKARALKHPANSHRALLPKPQGQGCAKCVALEEQLKIKSEEIRKLKEELLKYSKQGEDC